MSLTVLHNGTIVTGDHIGAGAVVIEGDRIRQVVYYSSPDSHYGSPGSTNSHYGSHCSPGSHYGSHCSPGSHYGFPGSGADSAEGGDGCASGLCPAPWPEGTEVVDLTGMLVFAGGIDAHVHFREPGLTWKADIPSESRAALAGGTTSFIDMPNTVPQTVCLHELEDKAALASGRSYANYGFHLGATDGNFAELSRAALKVPDRFAGIKLFLGSSTGGMKVGDPATLDRIFSIRGKTVSVHAEDDDIIRKNMEEARRRWGDGIPMSAHPLIRSRQACIEATRTALDAARRHGARLHVLHVSTAEEVDMILQEKRLGTSVTMETTINYLWFCDGDYDRLGGLIKCNPAVKSASDRERLVAALRGGEIDAIGSDHAPHLLCEKLGRAHETDCGSGTSGGLGDVRASDYGSVTSGVLGGVMAADYGSIPSGIPSVQLTLPVLLTLARRSGIPLQRIAAAISERPAEIFGIRDRGALRPGLVADIVVVDPRREWTVTRSGLPGKCGWSPYEGERLCASVEAVILNGRTAYIRDAHSPAGEAFLNSGGGREAVSPITHLPGAAAEAAPPDPRQQLTEEQSNEKTVWGPPGGRRLIFD